MNSATKEVMFSSATGVWATPQAFFDSLDAEFNFTLDPCANAENHKCDKYYTEAEDGLAQDWGGASVFSVTRHMGACCTSGLKSVIGRGARMERSWCC